jgi:hypothetical protein
MRTLRAGWLVTTSGRDSRHCTTATRELWEAIIATREARETLSLFALIGMDDPSKLEAYTKRLREREQVERRLRAGFSGR